jgi:hypothetical protein
VSPTFGMSSDRLEDDFKEPYAAWKATPGPATNTAMLKALHPTIEGAIRTHVGEPSPLLVSRARAMALQGLRGYDPKRGRLQTHMYNHLLGLKRASRQMTTVLKVPERVALDRHHLEGATQELAHELGREPTDGELADRTGFAPRRMARVRSYTPGVAEGALEAANPEAQAVFGGVRGPAGQRRDLWVDVVYSELDPYHQKVMELALGLGGRRPLANQDIARKLKKSPGAISQAKLRIQKMLDEGEELNPFGG